VTRTQGSAASNSQIATVDDPELALNTLPVVISSDGTTYGSSATENGVTVSNIVVGAGGQVTADVVANCTATNPDFL